MIDELIQRFPFVESFVGDHRNDVGFAETRIVSADVLNHLPSAGFDKSFSAGTQWNAFFLDAQGKALVKATPFQDEPRSVKRERGPAGKSVGRQFLLLAQEIRQKAHFILVQEWKTVCRVVGEEHHHIDIVLYRPPSRYTLNDFIKELVDEIRWLELDVPAPNTNG